MASDRGVASSSPAVQLNTSIKQVLVTLGDWPPYPDSKGDNFQDALLAYEAYYAALPPEKQKKLTEIFWTQIARLGTPIIESNPENPTECNVYFLMPKDKLAESKEAPGTKKNLYLQGDFHGYGSTDGRQKLSELSNTGIMWHRDSMPKESIVVYKYIQVEPSDEGKKPEFELPPFFTNTEGFIPRVTTFSEKKSENKSEKKHESICRDNCSNHTFPFPGFDGGERVFRVSTDSTHTHIPGKPIDWTSLLNTETKSDTRRYTYHATLYSDQAGDLHRIEDKPTRQYHDDRRNPTSPYANYTRDIHIFRPTSDKIDNIIFINDGTPYLLAGILDHFDKMINEGRLSPNTAFVFIDSLPGLKNTLSQSPEAAAAFDQDPSANNPGMGVRLIDYKHGIDKYIDFLADKLLPQLKKEGISVPNDEPKRRVMIGSSLSGTASIYINSKRPDLFGGFIAQSPSPDNRAILRTMPNVDPIDRNLHLSCGAFEHPDYAAANANVAYTTELAGKLGVPLRTGLHGHQFIAWNEELDRSLPETVDALREQLHFTKLTFEEFDQSPNSYCRKLTKAGKFEEAGHAAIEYLDKKKDLTDYQKCVIRWHIGQGFATCGQNELAIKYFRLAAEDKENMSKLFGPAANAYFNATVGFLNKDREAVEHQLQEALKISIKVYPPSNVVMIPGRIHDMATRPDLKYADVFKLTASLPPLPGEAKWVEIDAKDMNEEGRLVGEYLEKLNRPSFTQLQATSRDETPHGLPAAAPAAAAAAAHVEEAPADEHSAVISGKERAVDNPAKRPGKV